MKKLLLAIIIGSSGLIQSGFTKNLTDQQIVAADQTVKQFYNQLMPLLNQQGQQMLINDQQKWFQYRDQLVRDNPQNQGGVIYQSSVQRAAYLQSVLQQVRQQSQKKVTTQNPVVTQKKLDEPKGELINIPELPSDIVNCVLNPETKVWEKSSEKGRSSVWHTLVQTNSNNPIQVNIRTQYTGYLVDSYGWVNKTWSNEPAIYSSFDAGNLWNYFQYQITEDNERGIRVESSIPLESKNLQSITEYPASLEFQISNTSNHYHKIKDISLYVKDYMPFNKVIPLVIKDFINTNFAVSNIGWSEIKNGKIKLSQIAGSDIYENLKNYQYTSLDKGETYIKGDDMPAFNLLAFIKSSNGVSALRKTDDSCRSLFLKAEYELTDLKDQKSNITQYYTIFGENTSGQLHTILPADITLPDRKTGYRIKYNIDDEIPGGSSKKYYIKIKSEKSASVSMISELNLENEKINGREMCLNLETVKPNKSLKSGTAVSLRGGGDSVTYGQYQNLALESTFSPLKKLNAVREKAETDYHVKNKIFDGSQVIDTLEGFSKDLATIVRKGDFPKNIQPNNSKSTFPRVYRKIDEDLLCKVPIGSGSKKVVFSGTHADRLNACHCTIIDSYSGGALYRAPWSFTSDSANSSTQIEAVCSKTGEWVAWTVKNALQKNLYLLFPGKAETVFTLPFVKGSEISGIARNIDDDNLIISNKDETLEINLHSELLNTLLGMFKGGDTVADSFKRVKDVDENGNVNLYLPFSSFNNKSKTEKSFNAVIDINTLVNKTVAFDPLVAWFDKSNIGVKTSQWDVWSLKTGTKRPARNDEINAIENKISTDRSKIISNKKGEMSCSIEYDKDSSLDISYAPEYRDGDSAHPTIQDKVIRMIKKSKIKNEQLNFSFDCALSQSGPDFSKDPSLSKSFSVSPDNSKIVFSNQDGSILYLVDLINETYFGRVVQSSIDQSVITTVFNNGYYLSGNGKADDVVFSDGLNGYNLSQFEVIYNRPDIILEQLGADKSVIEQAKKLRARQASRSDFKSLEKASLIDIPVVSIKGSVPQSTEQRSISLDYQAENNTGPLRELKIYNNGALFATKPLNAPDGSPSMDVSGSETIQLASGDNLIQFCAINDDGVSSTFTTTKVTCTAPPVSKQCFIATVGISQYKDTNYSLQYAAKDAGDMASALADAARQRGLDPKVLVIKNDQASATLPDTIRKFLSSASIDDEVILFFAGHGLLDKNLGYHYPTYETDFNATEGTGIPFNELESLVEGIKPLKRTIFFDTCHSGEVEEDKKAQLQANIIKAQGSAATSPGEKGVTVHGIASRGMRISGVEQPVSLNDFVELEKLFPDSRRAKGANLLTSSSGSELSMESDEWKNGLFTYCFLKALKDPDADKNHDGKITFNELAEAVKERVSKLSGRKQRPITRGINREAETVIAINKNSPQPKHDDKTSADATQPIEKSAEKPVVDATQPSLEGRKSSLPALQAALDQAKRDLADALSQEAKALEAQRDYIRSQASAGGVKNFYQFSAATQQLQDASAKIEEKTAAVKAAEAAIQRWNAAPNHDVKVVPESVAVESNTQPTSNASGSPSSSSNRTSSTTVQPDPNTSTMRTDDLQAAVDQAKRDLDEALSEESKAQKDFSHTQLIAAGGIGKPAELSLSQQKYLDAVANVEQKKAAVKAAQAALDKQSSSTSADNPVIPSDKTDASTKALNDLQKLHDDLEKISKSLDAKKN